MLLAGLSTGWIVTIVVAAILTIATVVMYFLGRKMEKKQTEQQAMMEQNKQTVSMLIIDKKKVKFKNAGFPQSVIDQTPKYSRGMKVAAVKAKVGPQIVTLIADNDIFDSIPVKKEVKAVISGMYIMSIKEVRGSKGSEPVPKKKKNFLKRTLETLQEKAGATPVSADKGKKKKK